MLRLVMVFFALPWPVLALISAGLFWVAKDSHQRVTTHEAEKAEALRVGAPEPVALDAFTSSDVHLADEVHVTAWINADYNYELTKQRKGPDTVRRMYVLFGPGDGPDSKVARGVVVLHPDRMKDFTALLVANVADPADPRFLFHLNGARDETPDLADMVAEALAERGLVKGSDFLAVEPYLDGRAVALAPNEGAAQRNFTAISALGALVGLLALAKFWGRRRERAKPSAGADTGLPLSDSLSSQAPEPMGTVPTGQAYGDFATPATGVWSPIEAVKAKQMAIGGATARANAAEFTSAMAAPAKSRIGFRAFMHSVRNLSLAAVILGGLYLSFVAPVGQLPLNAMMAGIADFESGSDPFAVGPERVDAEQLSMPGLQGSLMPGGDLPTEAGSTVPMPEGIAGVEKPLPQVGDQPPAPADQVQEDIAAGMSPAEAIRRAIVAEFPDEETEPKFLSPGDGKPVTGAGLGQMLRDLIPQSWSGMLPLPDGVSVPGTERAGPDLPLPLPLLVAVVAAGAAGLLLMVMAVRLLLSRRSSAPSVAARTRSDPWDRLSDRLR